MKTNEQIYDEEIAPKLLEIAKRCQELGFSMIANVEYEHGETERTQCSNGEESFKQLLAIWAAKANGNVDALMMAVDRHARIHGHSSIYLQMAGNKNVKFGDNEMAALTITHS